MVQELQVLRCYSCDTFQSHIVKKSKKWECKICGANQSVKQVYGRGSGKDCRIHTQKLNALRGQKEEIDGPRGDTTQLSELVHDTRRDEANNDTSYKKPSSNCGFKQTNKWTEFIDVPECTSTEQNDCTNDNNADRISYIPITKVQKRKIDMDDGEQYPEEFNSATKNKKNFKREQSVTCFNKKSKFTFNTLMNNSLRSSIDDIQKDSKISLPGPSNKKSLSKQSWGKWSQYLENDEEPSPLNSQSTPDTSDERIMNKFTSNQDNCYKEEQKSSKIGSVELGLYSKSNNEFGINSNSKPKFLEVEQRRHHSDIRPKKSLTALSMQKTQIESEGIVLNGFKTSENLVLNNSDCKKSDKQTLNLHPSKGSYHAPSDMLSHGQIKSSNILLNQENVNSQEDVVRSGCKPNKDVNVQKVNVSVENSKLPFPPFFDQETDLTDADFQLDF